MTFDIRSKVPAGWTLLPVLLASGTSALAAWATESLPHTFITQQFRSAINEMVSAFDKSGEEIRLTAADLGARSKDMRLRTTSAADAAADAARNVEAVGVAARDLLALIARSGDQVAAAKDATDRTVHSLAAAAERILPVWATRGWCRRNPGARGWRRRPRGGRAGASKPPENRGPRGGRAGASKPPENRGPRDGRAGALNAA